MTGVLTLGFLAFGASHLRRKYSPTEDEHDTKSLQFWRLFFVFFMADLFLPLICSVLTPMLGAGLGVLSAFVFLFFACVVAVSSLALLALLIIGPVILFSSQANLAFDSLLEQLRLLAEALFGRTKMGLCNTVKCVTPKCVGDGCCAVPTKEKVLEKAKEVSEIARSKAEEVHQWAVTEGIPLAKDKSKEFSTLAVEKSQEALEVAKSYATWAKETGAEGVLAQVSTSLADFEKQRTEKRLKDLRVRYDAVLEAAAAATKASLQVEADRARRRAVNLNAQLKTIDLDLAAEAKKDGPKKVPSSPAGHLFSVLRTAFRITHHACEYHLTGVLLAGGETIRCAAESLESSTCVADSVTEVVEKMDTKTQTDAEPSKKAEETQTEEKAVKTEETQTDTKVVKEIVVQIDEVPEPAKSKEPRTPVTETGSETEELDRSVSDERDVARTAPTKPVLATPAAPKPAPVTVQYQ